MKPLAVLTASIFLSTPLAVAAEDASHPTRCCNVDTSTPVDASAKLIWDQSFPERQSVATEVQQYPKVPKRLGQEGRVLVEFRVRNDGVPVHIKLVRSSDNARLDDQGLRILRGTLFARSPSSQRTEVFRETVAFCIDKCAQAVRFADSQGLLLVITAAPSIRATFRVPPDQAADPQAILEQAKQYCDGIGWKFTVLDPRGGFRCDAPAKPVAGTAK